MAEQLKSCQRPQAHPARCGCEQQGTEQVSSAWLAQLREEYRLFGEQCKRLTAEVNAKEQRCRELESTVERMGAINKDLAKAGLKACSELERLQQFERICAGLSKDCIDGGFTVAGLQLHCKRVEEERAALRTELAARPTTDAYDAACTALWKHRDEAALAAAALKPFADAFASTHIQGYAGADKQLATFLDGNRITPASGLTVRQYRLAWELLSGKSALLGKEASDA